MEAGNLVPVSLGLGGEEVIAATVAARLAQHGKKVVLFDQSSPGTGTSSTPYVWLNSNGKDPRAHYDLNFAGLEAHKRLSPTDETGHRRRMDASPFD